MYFLCVKATVEGWRGGGAWRRPEEQHLNGDVVGRFGERAGEGGGVPPAAIACHGTGENRGYLRSLCDVQKHAQTQQTQAVMPNDQMSQFFKNHSIQTVPHIRYPNYF